MNFPIEIIDKILDYREELLWTDRFNNDRNDILFKSAMMRCNYYGIDCGSDMPDEIDKDEALMIYKTLYNCKCCKYHSVKKPPPYLFVNGYCPPYYDYYHWPDQNIICRTKNNTNCKCKCLEHSEMLCREYNDDYSDDDDIQRKLLNQWHVNNLHRSNIINR